MIISNYNKNIFSNKALHNSNTIFREFRAKGDIIYLSKQNLYAFTSYKGVKFALSNPKIFISGNGVAINGLMNRKNKQSVIGCDNLIHRKRKGIMVNPMTPAKIQALKKSIYHKANELIKELIQKEKFDVIQDFAAPLPLKIVSDYIGLRQKDTKKLRGWAFDAFNASGPLNWKTFCSLWRLLITFNKFHENLNEEQIIPDSWSDRIFKLAKDGRINLNEAKDLVISYLIPSLDTTILSAGCMFSLLASNPEKYYEIRSNINLIPAAVNEVLRLASPARWLSRTLSEDFVFSNHLLKKGSRVLLLIASANQDEKYFINPNDFNLHRIPSDHLSFGIGVHGCMGEHLARLELEALLSAMCNHVEKLKIENCKYITNNVLQGLESAIGNFIYDN